MSYIALYRKYRPSNFSNVVGQDTIIKVLKNSLTSGHISHAYLFSGPRGTGKTSIAKIFARAVNCQNFTDDLCGTCQNCTLLLENDTDIIEIDAASNNGVDEIRTLRDNVKLLPSFCKYKVYIIDEVHMLSTGAFNALLKTLEEPPSHVIFVLATTEPSKIPLTILSRCQRFDFSKIDNVSLFNRLKYILKQENRNLPDEVVSHIAITSDGGLRDAINLLDQALSLFKDDVSIDDIDRLSGQVSFEFIVELFDIIFFKNYVSLLKLMNSEQFNSKDFTLVINNMLKFVRDISINSQVTEYFDKSYSDILFKYVLSSNQILKITNLLNELLFEIRKSVDQKILFEIYMFNLMELLEHKKINVCDIVEKIDNQKIVQQNETLDLNNEEDIVNNDSDLICEDNSNEINFDLSNIEELKKIRINNVFVNADKNLLHAINLNYDRINDYISSKIYNSVAALLLEGKVVVASYKYLLFSFDNSSFVNAFDHSYKQIELFVSEVFDSSYKVVAVSSEKWEEIRKNFILNKKNNVKYVFIDENVIELETGNQLVDFENSALSLFGEDTVSVK